MECVERLLPSLRGLAIPKGVVPYLENWARDPHFDRDGIPYMVVPAFTPPGDEEIRWKGLRFLGALRLAWVVERGDRKTDQVGEVPVVHSIIEPYTLSATLKDLVTQCGLRPDEPIPRHHLLLVACVCSLARTCDDGLGGLSVALVPPPCVMSYTVTDFAPMDPTETVHPNPDGAIALHASLLPDPDTASAEELRASVKALRAMIASLKP